MIGPRRIVCLTEEPTETLYALGEQLLAPIGVLFSLFFVNHQAFLGG